MAAGNVARTIRAPGRLVVNPTTAFASTAYPHGGTEVGFANQCIVQPLGTPLRIECEGLGEATDILEPNRSYVFTCFLRGWDDDAIEKCQAQSFVAGATSQHAVYRSPDNVPGASSIGRAVILAYIPDDPLHVPGVLIYRGIVDWSSGAEVVFQRGAELGLPLTVDCLRDASGSMLKIGRMADLILS